LSRAKEKSMNDATLAATAAVRSYKPLTMPGVSIALLREHDGERTLVLRMDPGAQFPRHTHPGGEQLLVLSGDVEIAGRALGAGDYLYTAPGDVHAVASRGGCELFITVPRPIEVLGEPPR
jgi:quercetin dioxygenase-like cupin family protein